MNTSTLSKARKVVTEDVELGSGTPPPRKTRAGASFENVYRDVCALAPGGWLVWKTAPKSFHGKVKQWKKLSGLPLVAYTDPDGRAIVQRLRVTDADGGDGDGGEADPEVE